jgi:hypothetical protein
MKRMNAVLVAAAVGIAIAPARARVLAPTQAAWTSLWNGRNLDGWTTWIATPDRSVAVADVKRDDTGKYLEPIGPERDPLGIFSVVQIDGRPAIRISGQVFGELRTKTSLQNYHLRLQFRWGDKKWPPRAGADTPRDSGLLYHVHSAPGDGGRVWARSIELQIQEHDVGDLYAIGSVIAVRAKARRGTSPLLYDYDANGDWTFFSQAQGASGRCIKQPDNEKPTGEWNTVELIAFGQDSIHIVNGRIVMRLHGPLDISGAVPVPVTSGPIILQSEGAEVFYRDVEWRPITAIPAEFR